MIEYEKVRKDTIRSIEGTVGGRTYYVVLPGRGQEEKALCFRPIHKHPEMRCTRPAGFDTDHNGTGACKYHGGRNNQHIAVTTARWSKVTQTRLAQSIEHYMSLDRNTLMDMSYELAVSKSVFDAVVNTIPDLDTVTAEESMYTKLGVALMRLESTINTMSNLMERISRVENRNTITAAQVLYIRATVADILMKYLPDPKLRERAARELASRMGGDMEAEIKPFEMVKV